MDEKTHRLVWNIKMWTRILDEAERALNQRQESTFARSKAARALSQSPERHFAVNPYFGESAKEELRTEVFTLWLNLHMIAVCLRQIDGFAKWLKSSPIWSGAVAQKGETFRSSFASEELKNLRDVLEHTADYVAGEGHKPELLIDPQQNWPSVLLVNKRVVEIMVFGKSYKIDAAILAGNEFNNVLPSVAPAGGLLEP